MADEKTSVMDPLLINQVNDKLPDEPGYINPDDIDDSDPVEKSEISGEKPVKADTKDEDAANSSDDEGRIKTGDEAADKSPKKNKGGLKKRFHELTTRANELERRAESAEAELQRVTTKTSENKRPDPRNYQDKTNAEYFSDLAKYEAAEIVRETLEKSAKEVAAKAATEAKSATDAVKGELQSRFDSRVEELRQAKPDFDKVAFARDLPVSDAAFEEMLQSERGADILYHLGQNPELAEEVASLKSPREVSRAIWRIESSLDKLEDSEEDDTPSRPTTKAPAPLKPVKGTGVTRQFDVNNASYEEHKAQARKDGRIR